MCIPNGLYISRNTRCVYIFHSPSLTWKRVWPKTPLFSPLFSQTHSYWLLLCQLGCCFCCFLLLLPMMRLVCDNEGMLRLECGEFAMEEGVCYGFQCTDDDRSSCLPLPSQFIPSYFESMCYIQDINQSIQSVDSSEGGLYLPSAYSHFCLQKLWNANLWRGYFVFPIPCSHFVVHTSPWFEILQYMIRERT